ncbi:hypothetical protein Plhal304r1_c009g0036111 [Plasmopara halstedii]
MDELASKLSHPKKALKHFVYAPFVMQLLRFLQSLRQIRGSWSGW